MSKKVIISLIILLVFVIMIADFRLNGVRVFEDFYRHMETDSMREMYQGGFHFSGESVEKEISPYVLEIDDNIRELKIDNIAGSIDIRGDERDDILLSYKITVYAKTEEIASQFIEDLELLEEFRDDRIILALNDFDLIENINGLQLDYNLRVPENIYLDLINRYGILSVQQMVSDLELKNSYGNMELDGIIGKINLYARYGDLYVRNITGNSKIDSSYNSTEIYNIDGDMELNSSYNENRVRDVKGNTDIRIRYGSLNIANVEGNLDLQAQYTGIRGEQIRGKLKGNLSYGGLELRNIMQDLDISARYTDIDINLDRNLENFLLDISNKNKGIYTNLDFTVKEEDRTKILQGESGNGDVQINIDNSNGDVRINQ
ncbi:MAG: DUF4097 family beta strand repeat-containing protein [Halanaerobiales bacterium]